MNYYLDTEFHEYKKKTLFSKGINTIELISIGIIREDGKKFYAISKDFDIKAAFKNEWLRENVLRPIYNDLLQRERYARNYHNDLVGTFSIKCLTTMINWNGRTNVQIREDIKNFCAKEHDVFENDSQGNMLDNRLEDTKDIKFYGYYSDYDWVVFCWLFGRMIDLPKSFPMFCVDLKQMLDDKVNSINFINNNNGVINNLEELRELTNKNDIVYYFGERNKKLSIKDKLKIIKELENYPKLGVEHDALEDANWNLNLHKFINNITA